MGFVAGETSQVVKYRVTEALPPLPDTLICTEKVLLLPLGVAITAVVAVVPVTLALLPVAVTEVEEALAVVKPIVMLEFFVMPVQGLPELVPHEA
jgi:hypothetical protein